MSDLKKAFSKKNLHRAWRWINTNPSYQYKNYFRDSYIAYSLSLDENISDLSKRLKDGVYQSNVPTLILLPKNNISTRPYSLLTVEDQIVYQAIVNIVADTFYSKLKKNYYNLTFGNLYAGKRSTFFYRKWDKGFQIFNREIRKSYSDGYKYIATFDLTACYDSIDHNVLSYMLEESGMEKEFTVYLCELLKKWSSNIEIYKGHGIPQGPLSSGLLAEVLLSYFDEKYKKLKNRDDIKYFRYVDDIKLLANDERTLMRMLARLDYYSKQVGVFPQSSKIEIKQIVNIDEEINSISKIDDKIFISKMLKKINLYDEFKKTYSGTKVLNKTKFKMYLASLTPNSKVSDKVIKILSLNPQYFQNISLYFSKYQRKISDGVIDKILIELEKPEAFQVVSASIMDSIAFNTTENSKVKILNFCKSRRSRTRKLNPQMRYVIMKILLVYNELTYNEIKDYLENENDWWIKKSLLKYIDITQFGEPSYIEILKDYLASENVELYSAAVNEIIEKDIDLSCSNDIDYRAQKMLKYTGNLERASTRPSIIGKTISGICDDKVPSIKWKKVFGIDHRHAENKIIRAFSYSKSDMSALVNILDTFNDMLLDKLHKKDNTIGGYSFGNIGSSLFNTGTKLEKKYPNTFKYCKYIHDLRLQCDLSHPVVKKTKKYTNPIKYREIFVIRKSLKEALHEISSVW